jgi:hypothetical protein
MDVASRAAVRSLQQESRLPMTAILPCPDQLVFLGFETFFERHGMEATCRMLAQAVSLLGAVGIIRCIEMSARALSDLSPQFSSHEKRIVLIVAEPPEGPMRCCGVFFERTETAATHVSDPMPLGTHPPVLLVQPFLDPVRQ